MKVLSSVFALLATTMFSPAPGRLRPRRSSDVTS